MASAVSSSEWVQGQSGFALTKQKVNGREYQVLSKEKMNTSTMLWYFSEIITKTIHEASDLAKKKISTFQASGMGAFPGALFALNPKAFAESINFHADQMVKELSGNSSFEVLMITGTNSKGLLSCLELARKIALEFFNKQIFFSYASKPADIEKWVTDTTFESASFSYQKTGSKIDENPASFSAEQKIAFGITDSEITQDPQLLSCFAYALLETGETRAKDLIFTKKGSFTKLLDVLHKWGYVSVSNPTKGDLVVYLNVKDELKHMGVFVEDQKVHSKLGNFTATPFTHRILDVSLSYGNKVLFLHKT